MGEDLSLPERNAIRTPMQWSDSPNAGFSPAPKKRLVRPVVTGGDFGYEQVNVDHERDDASSLLAWFERMLRALRECPEFGEGRWALLDSGDPGVLALRYDSDRGAAVAITNLGDKASTVDLGVDVGTPVELLEMFANRRYERPHDISALKVDGWGYRWLRIA